MHPHHIKAARTILNNANNKVQQLLLNNADTSVFTVLTQTISTVKTELQSLNELKVQIQRELDKMANNIDKRVKIIDKFTKMHDIYILGDYKQKRQILQLIVDRIVVTDYDDITIYTNLWP